MMTGIKFAEHLRDPIRAKGKKRILACDGGGILGLMTVEVLGAIETLLRKETGKPNLVLGDWFDMCAGTSTGAMIATCVAYGMPVDEIRRFYTEHGRDMFNKAFLFDRIYYKYDDESLAQILKKLLVKLPRLELIACARFNGGNSQRHNRFTLANHQ